MKSSQLAAPPPSATPFDALVHVLLVVKLEHASYWV
jgi:hypothetical protein